MTVSGSITAQEFDNALATMTDAIERHGRIRLLENVGELDTPPIPWNKLWDNGRVATGDCSPVAPTDPDVPNSGIRLLGLDVRYVA